MDIILINENNFILKKILNNMDTKMLEEDNILIRELYKRVEDKYLLVFQRFIHSERILLMVTPPHH